MRMSLIVYVGCLLLSALSFKVRRLSLTLNVMQNTVLTTKLLLTGHSSAARQCRTWFWVIVYSFFMVGGRGKRGKWVEIDDSCFSRQKCNWGRLCATAWVFVNVERELGTPVLHLLLNVLPRHCWPSLRRVSYPAPKSSVTAVGTAFIPSMKDSHNMPSITPTFFWRTDASTNMIEAR